MRVEQRDELRWKKDKNQFALFLFQPDAPFIPKVTGAGDTQNFDEYDEEPIKVSSNLHCAKEFDDFWTKSLILKDFEKH